MGPVVSNGDACAVGGNFESGNALGDDGHAPVVIEAGQTGRVAGVSCLHAIQLCFPGGTAHGHEAAGADGVDGAVFVHAVGEFEVDEVIGNHVRGTSETQLEELQSNAFLIQK